MVMHVNRWKPVVLGGAVLAAMGLAACSSASGAPVAAAPPPPPRLVTAKSVGGAAGKGPLVIASPSSLPAGKASSQKVVLSDRTLVISSVSRRQATDKNTTLIELNLVVRNTSAKAIGNKPAFFELMSSGGDIFSYKANSSDGFYGNIDAHASRAGMIEFQIPTVAASSLYLLYRPESGAKAVLTRLTMG
jgi:hypothetical protein